MLHANTQQLLQELFAGHSCSRCGQPARRFRRDKFYCPDCFPARRSSEVRVRRVCNSLLKGKKP